MISSEQPFMAVKSQFSNDLAKLRNMELVNDPGIFIEDVRYEHFDQILIELVVGLLDEYQDRFATRKNVKFSPGERKEELEINHIVVIKVFMFKRVGRSPVRPLFSLSRTRRKNTRNHGSINLSFNILWQDFFRIFFHTDVDGLVVVGAAPKVAPDRFHRVELQADDGVQHGLFVCTVQGNETKNKQNNNKR